MSCHRTSSILSYSGFFTRGSTSFIDDEKTFLFNRPTLYPYAIHQVYLMDLIKRKSRGKSSTLKTGSINNIMEITLLYMYVYGLTPVLPTLPPRPYFSAIYLIER